MLVDTMRPIYVERDAGGLLLPGFDVQPTPRLTVSTEVLDRSIRNVHDRIDP
ncbi:MAG TPA: hypothetical protein VHG32_15315 [Thermoanaerobaculia bacterium]|jgi:hypothetical protein|nr:hypothetical protein [Thermoanaerobaculia bacterium]